MTVLLHRSISSWVVHRELFFAQPNRKGFRNPRPKVYISPELNSRAAWREILKEKRPMFINTPGLDFSKDSRVYISRRRPRSENLLLGLIEEIVAPTTRQRERLRKTLN